MSALNWQPIANAPKDGSPVWARGHDFGVIGNPMHCGWVYWSDDDWTWAGDSGDMAASHIIEYLPAAAPTFKPGVV